MNRILLSLIPVSAAFTALGQTPVAPPPAPARIVSESGKVARILAGPGDRPEGFLLRNGTFVSLPPGLSQRLPSTLSNNASISVTGDEFTYDGSRTIHAQRISLAGIPYEDAPTAALAPPPPVAPGTPAPPPRGPAAAAAPPPCQAAAAPNAPPPPPSAARMPQAPPPPPPVR